MALRWSRHTSAGGVGGRSSGDDRVRGPAHVPARSRAEHALAQGLTALVPGEAHGLLQGLCAQLAVQLGRAHVAVEEVGADEPSGPSSVGSVTGHHLEQMPLLHAGEQVGTLVMSQSELRWLRPGQRRAVRQLLPYVALVVAAARLSEERDAARREVVSVREEERAELRRLLHDAAAGLSGVALQLDVAADDVTAERAEQLARMREEISGVARTMRGLAYERGRLRSPTPGWSRLSRAPSLRCPRARDSRGRSRCVAGMVTTGFRLP